MIKEKLLLACLTHHSYLFLFIAFSLGILGLPIPDETLLILSGLLVKKGSLNFIATVCINLSGTICGISLSYLLGRFFEKLLLHHFIQSMPHFKKTFDKTTAFYQKYGKFLLTFAYFIPGVKHFSGILAGTFRLPFQTFAVFAYSGAILWNTIFFSLGYAFGPSVLHQANILLLATQHIFSF